NVDSLMKLVAALDSAGIELIGEGAVSHSGGRGVRLKVGSGGRPPKPPTGEGERMAVTAELWCVALLIAVAALAVIPAVRAASHIVSAAMLAVTVIGFIVALFAMAAPASSTVLPLGLPLIGARFRVDALSAFFLLVVDFGAAAACLYGIGYGRHEHEPQRVV